MNNKIIKIFTIVSSFSLLSSCVNKGEVVENYKIILTSNKSVIEVGEKTSFSYRSINFDSSLIEVISLNEDIVKIEEGKLVGEKEGTATIKAYKKDNEDIYTLMSIEVSKSEDTVEFFYYDFDSRYGRRKSLNSIGKQNVLVLPICVKDYESNATSENLERLNEMFNSKKGDSWESVSSFYYKSSYEKLDLNFIFPDSWYNCGLNPLEIQQKYNQTYGQESDGGSGLLIDEAISWYKENYEFDNETFDQNNDGWIDAVWCIYSSPTMALDPDYYEELYPGINVDNYWAFTTTAFQYNSSKYAGKGSLISPLLKVYSWASYDFMDKYDEEGTIDAHTYIHETGHLLGLNDYYAYSNSYISNAPAGCIDMMDQNIGDHTAFSKFALGWVKPKIVTKTMRISLRPFTESGDFVVISSDDYNKSAFDEYFTIEYVTPTGLNTLDYTSVYPENLFQGYSENGIRIYHVDSRGKTASDPWKYTTNLDDYYDVANTNTYNNSARTYSSNRPMYLLTLMQNNITKSSNTVLAKSNAYYFSIRSDNENGDPDNALYHEGDVFGIDESHPERILMPSSSNRLNKYITTYDSALHRFNYEVKVVSLTEKEAIIDIIRG